MTIDSTNELAAPIVNDPNMYLRGFYTYSINDSSTITVERGQARDSTNTWDMNFDTPMSLSLGDPTRVGPGFYDRATNLADVPASGWVALFVIGSKKGGAPTSVIAVPQFAPYVSGLVQFYKPTPRQLPYGSSGSYYDISRLIGWARFEVVGQSMVFDAFSIPATGGSTRQINFHSTTLVHLITPPVQGGTFLVQPLPVLGCCPRASTVDYTVMVEQGAADGYAFVCLTSQTTQIPAQSATIENQLYPLYVQANAQAGLTGSVQATGGVTLNATISGGSFVYGLRYEAFLVNDAKIEIYTKGCSFNS